MKLKIFFITLICFFLFNSGISAQFRLAEGTLITMADDSKKNIEKIRIGDIVLAFNTKDRVYEEKKVKSINRVMINRLVRIMLETGMHVTMSVDYPIWGEKGWISIDPEMTKLDTAFGNVKRGQEGDFVLFYNVTSTDYVELTAVRGILDPTQTYEIELEDGSLAIIANGFLLGQNHDE